MGRYARDEVDLLREELARLEGAVGSRHPDLLPCLSQLGWELRMVERLEEAEGCYLRALDLLNSGQDPEREADLLFHLGRLHYEKDELESSETVLRQALARRRALKAGEPADLGWTLQFLAETCFSLEKYPEAENALREAVSVFLSCQGPDHPDTAMATNWLGHVLEEMKRFPEAEGRYREAIRIVETILGPGGAIVDMLERLAAVLDAQGKADEARDLRVRIDRERRTE